MATPLDRAITRLRASRPMRLEALEDRCVPATFEVVGTTLLVNGTGGVDHFVFSAGDTVHEIAVSDGAGNTQTYAVDSAQIDTILVEGEGDFDTATLAGNSGSDIAVLGARSGVLIGNSYLVQFGGFEEVNVFGGENDSARFEDSSAADTFIGGPGYGTMTGDPGTVYTNNAFGFGSVDAVSSLGGADLAVLNDSAGNDTFSWTAGYGTMYGEGYAVSASGFTGGIQANATTGDNIAYLIDSAGDDTYSAFQDPNLATMNAGGFSAAVSGFNAVTALFVNGGTDSAFFFGSAAHENFFGNSAEASLSGNQTTKSAVGADNVFVYMAQGGDDSAFVYDAPGSNDFTGSGTTGTLSGTGYSISLNDFDVVRLYGISGGANTLLLSDLAYHFYNEGFTQDEELAIL